MHTEVTSFPRTRQGVRDLDRFPRFVPASAGPIPPMCVVNVGDTERAASTILGGGLIGVCLANPSITSLVGAFVGGALIYRGISGHCELNRILGRSTAAPGHAADELAYLAQ